MRKYPTDLSDRQWRMPPKEYPVRQGAYHYFRKWKRDGTLKEVHDAPVPNTRKANGEKEAPKDIQGL